MCARRPWQLNHIFKKERKCFREIGTLRKEDFRICSTHPQTLSLERQTCRKNQISSMKKAGIRLPASFYKHPSPAITSVYPKSFNRPSTIDLFVLNFPTSRQPLQYFHILTPLMVLSSTYHFFVTSCFSTPKPSSVSSSSCFLYSIHFFGFTCS